MNRWVMVFPCLMYLACIGTCSLCPPQADRDTLTDTTEVAMGIAQAYFGAGAEPDIPTAVNSNTAYLSISLSLNVILTFMIVTQLALHIRNIRKVVGASTGANGLHKTAATVVTMLIESYALYAVVLLVYIVPWALNSPVQLIFFAVTGPIQVRAFLYFSPMRCYFGTSATNCGCIQVIAPYLIILRVAKRRELTSETISGSVGSLRFRSQVTTDGDESLPDEDEDR